MLMSEEKFFRNQSPNYIAPNKIHRYGAEAEGEYIQRDYCGIFISTAYSTR